MISGSVGDLENFRRVFNYGIGTETLAPYVVTRAQFDWAVANGWITEDGKPTPKAFDAKTGPPAFIDWKLVEAIGLSIVG